ncbi:hypothetical protein CVT26_005248 [Gymnopilus dilepis]|uniref:Uncharacterized protein n=1 Tax=Gymnopilus dilepis TaxID=231916 RepID=A0A409YVJ3_9AGAR|nr:hypothetical protein CVT26_005248 [Gymnopilus dilepis]
MVTLQLAVVFLLTFVSRASAAIQKTVPRPSNPFLDPKHDPYNPLKYIASNVLTGIAFGLVLVVAIIQTWFIKRLGAKWMMSMTIGAYFFALGLAFRFGLHSHPESKGIYIVEYMFVVLSPCAFIAADYVLLGRLAKHLNADKHLLVRSRRITITFAAGGGLTASANQPAKALAGSRVGAVIFWDYTFVLTLHQIFLAGLVAQLLSFLCFTGIYIVFLYRVWRYEPEIWARDNNKKWRKSWQALAFALIVSCIGILIRSGYRVAELSEGFDGPLTTSQALFYGVDTLPLFVAIAIYIPFWPGRFIRSESRQIPDDKIAHEKESESSTA